MMTLRNSAFALATIALCTALPAAAQSSVTLEAEDMKRSKYALEGNVISVAKGATSGTATRGFSGASGIYDVRVRVEREAGGQPTLEVYKGSNRLRKYTYPLGSGFTSFTIRDVTLNKGQTIKLIGRVNKSARARVDKIVFTPVASATTTTESVTTTSTEPVSTTPIIGDALGSVSACANPSGGYEGFGRNTTGGAGKSVYRVTNLKDSGAGSLRDALSQGNRCVVFDVGGTIKLSGNLLVKGANVTIDGLTAPSPGITLRDRTFVVQGSSGAGNVVVRGIRMRSTPSGMDAMRIYNASNVVVDRVSVSGFGDGALDVTEKSRDVTIQWSILGDGTPDHNLPSLIKYDTSRITVHHNLYINGTGRHPYCGRSPGATSLPAEVVCDVRNNLIWNYSTTGTSVRQYGTANVVNNYYYTAAALNGDKTIYLAEGGSAHVSGNYSRNGWNLATGDRATPFAAVAPATTDAVTAAKQVLAKAGARGPKFGLDSADQSFIGQVSVD